MSLTRPLFLVTALTLLTVAALGGVAYGQSLTSHESEILMSINLQPHENEFLADDGYYQVSSFQLMVNNSQDLCPTGNCEYTLEDGEFRTNTITGGYTLDGKLKSTVTEGDTRNSKFFLINAQLDKVGSEETPSKLTGKYRPWRNYFRS